MDNADKVTIRQLNELTKLLEPVCRDCAEITDHQSDTRCCDNAFCTITEIGLKNLGLEYNVKVPNPKAKYLGPKGCIIPPKHRPFCTSFACPMALKDRKIKRAYDRLHNKIRASDYMAKARENSPSVEEVMKILMKKD